MPLTTAERQEWALDPRAGNISLACFKTFGTGQIQMTGQIWQILLQKLNVRGTENGLVIKVGVAGSKDTKNQQ